MRRPAGVAVVSLGLLVALAAAPRSAGAAEQKVFDQVTAKNKAAAAAYENGDFDKMKAQVLKAISLGEKGGLGGDAVLAESYMLAGVLYVDGLEQKDAAVRHFAKALKIAPDAAIPEGMGTKAVVAAFKEARSQASADEPAEAPKPRGGAKKEAVAATEEPAADEEVKEKVEREPTDSKGKPDRERQLAEAKARIQGLEREKADLEKRLADGKDRVRKEQDAKEKLSGDRQDRDKLLAEAKGSLQGLEREKTDLEKRLTDANSKLAKERDAREKLAADKQGQDKIITEAKAALLQLQKDKADLEKKLAEANDRASKEKDAKEKLAADKQDKEKQLADTKGLLQQTQKDKTDKEKLLAETKERERKEREAKDKLEKDRQLAEARDKERKAKDEQERQEREKLAAGPDLPSRIPEPVHCAIGDEAQAGADLYVHCVAKPELKAKTIAFYYRSSGIAHYNSAAMERNKKGWYLTVIPAAKVTGKILQYYAEARDGREAVAAANGKANSPNVVTLRPAGPPRVAKGR